MALGIHAKAVWGASGEGGHRDQPGAPPLRSQRIGPAQQVSAHLREQEAMSGDPADDFEHGDSAGDKVRRRWRRRQWRQSHTQRRSLFAKAADPELAALIRHGVCWAACAAAARVRPWSRRATKNSEITVRLKRSQGSAKSGNKDTVRWQRDNGLRASAAIPPGGRGAVATRRPSRWRVCWRKGPSN